MARRPFIYIQEEITENQNDEVLEENLINADEVDIESVIEETVNAEHEIANDTEILDATMEEVDILSEQVEKTEQVIENNEPEEVIIEQVTATQEAFRESLIRLGLKNTSYYKLSISKEDDEKISTKGMNIAASIAAFIGRLINGIRRMISIIIHKIKEYFTRIKFKFANYPKKIDALVEDIKKYCYVGNEIVITNSQETLDELTQALQNESYAEFAYALSTDKLCASMINGNLYAECKKAMEELLKAGDANIPKSLNDFKKLEEKFKNKQFDNIDGQISNALGGFNSIFDKFKKYKFEDFGLELEDNSEDIKFKFPIVTGTSVFCFTSKGSVKKLPFVKTDKLKNIKLDKYDANDIIDDCMTSLRLKYLKEAASNIGKVANDINNIETNAAKIVDMADKSLKTIMKNTTTNDSQDKLLFTGLRYGVSIVKCASISFSTYVFQCCTNQLTSYVKLLNIINKIGHNDFERRNKTN